MAIFDYNPSAITPFPYWRWNKVLPAVYDDSVSQYEMLCRLLSVVNNIIESTNSTGEQVEALTQLVQQLIDGGFPSGLVEYVNQIVDAAMEDDIERINDIIDDIRTKTGDDIAAIDARVTELSAAIDARVTELSNYIHNTFVYNVLDYGAIGDGTTDDTDAVQAAFDACTIGSTVYFPTGRGQAYKISNTITITTPFIKVVCDEIPSLAWQEHGIKFYPAATNSLLFNIAASGVTFSNILASSNTWHTGIFAVSRIDAADTDVAFNDINIVNFNIGFQHYNRGFKLFNSTISNCTDCVEIHSDSYITNTGQNTVRGIVINNNRLHNIHHAVRVFSTITNGMQINNNLIDYYPSSETGNAILVDEDNNDANTFYYGLSVCNNTVLNCGFFGVDIWATNATIINNNTFVNRAFAAQGFIRVRGTAATTTISNNNFGTCYQDAIYAHGFVQSVISGNNMIAVARNSSNNSYGGIRFTSGHGFVITNNSISVLTPANSRPIIYDGTSDIKNAIISNNTSPNQSGIFINVNNATITNSKIQTLITD